MHPGMAGEFFNAEPPGKPTPDMDWWVKVMTIIILWPIPLPSLECVRRASCYNIHILFNFPATLWNWNPGEFGNRAKGLSGRCLIPKSPLHCPRHGQPTPGLVMLFKWRVFDVCRVDCLKYWVGQKMLLPVLPYHCMEKPEPTFGPTK